MYISLLFTTTNIFDQPIFALRYQPLQLLSTVSDVITFEMESKNYRKLPVIDQERAREIKFTGVSLPKMQGRIIYKLRHVIAHSEQVKMRSFRTYSWLQFSSYAMVTLAIM